MKRSQERGQPEHRLARLARTKAKVDNSEEFGSIRLGDAHFRSGSEDEGIIVGQVEVIVTLGQDQAAPAEPEVEEGEREASVVRRERHHAFHNSLEVQQVQGRWKPRCKRLANRVQVFCHGQLRGTGSSIMDFSRAVERISSQMVPRCSGPDPD